MNPLLKRLQPYPFEKLAELKRDATPPEDLRHIALSIGEPKHAPPDFALQALSDNLSSLAKYPLTKGEPALREAIAKWATRRFHLDAKTYLSAETQVLPVAGTREALFSFTQACVDPSADAVVVMPNPFYQIYEGAALLAGASPVFLNCTEENNFLPNLDDIDADTWERCQLLFLCSPGNPTGAICHTILLRKAMELADKYNFIIASDECYSELYFDENRPPLGLLEFCAQEGRHDFRRCVVFHSLSKRSNLPGLRSGFVAGDANLLADYLRYRTYEGCALPLPTQHASIAAWEDETHVQANRAAYREKFKRVLHILQAVTEVQQPDAGFYLWLKTPIDDRDFARELYNAFNITVLPGQFLARPTADGNPGTGYVRMALVAPIDECVEAAERIVQWFKTSQVC